MVGIHLGVNGAIKNNLIHSHSLIIYQVIKFYDGAGDNIWSSTLPAYTGICCVGQVNEQSK